MQACLVLVMDDLATENATHAFKKSSNE
jgi:hypothetical protein